MFLGVSSAAQVVWKRVRMKILLAGGVIDDQIYVYM